MSKGRFFTPTELVWHFAKIPLAALVFAAIGYAAGHALAKTEQPVVETIEIVKPAAEEKCVEYPTYVSYPVHGGSQDNYDDAVWLVIKAKATESQAEIDTIEGIGKRRIYGYFIATRDSYNTSWIRADHIDSMKEVNCANFGKTYKRVRK